MNMKMMKQRWVRGFTLLEMLLVMTIVSMFIFVSVGYVQQRTLALSIDRASAQMQQVLNAGLSYYVNNGTWPADLTTLQNGSYLPTGAFNSPWGTSYSVSSSQTLFSVSMSLPAALVNQSAIGTILAGKLPLATSNTSSSTTQQPCGVTPWGAPMTCPVTTTTSTITAYVNVPGQNLNNASAVNYAGLYHNGACVPAPECPVDKTGATMTPQVLLVPVSVSGMNDNSTNVYPMSSFTAYATTLTDTASGGPPACASNANQSTACYSDVWGGTPISSGKYWRACLQVVTEKGSVVWTSTTGQYATILAITRCGITNENTGSGFNVWAP